MHTSSSPDSMPLGGGHGNQERAESAYAHVGNVPSVSPSVGVPVSDGATLDHAPALPAMLRR